MVCIGSRRASCKTNISIKITLCNIEITRKTICRRGCAFITIIITNSAQPWVVIVMWRTNDLNCITLNASIHWKKRKGPKRITRIASNSIRTSCTNSHARLTRIIIIIFEVPILTVLNTIIIIQIFFKNVNNRIVATCAKGTCGTIFAGECAE